MHSGKRGWEDTIIQRLDMTEKNPMHTNEDLARIESLVEKIVKLRNEER